MIRLLRSPRSPARSGGFTLVELLIVMSIILIILSMTLATLNYSRTGDKVSAAARQIQSFVSGARNRAMYANESRGVRLFIEQNLGGSAAALRTVTTMAYIAPGGTWAAPKDSARVQLERLDGNGDGDYEDPGDLILLVRGFNNPGWWNLKRRGLLVDGMRIRIPAGPSGQWYPITTGSSDSSSFDYNPSLDVTQPPPDEQLLRLQVPFADGGDGGQLVAFSNLTYEIELPTRLLPQDPSILPEGVVIDLDGSKVPASWRPSSAGGVYSGYMDIMFSPRGSVVGDAASLGVLHLYVCDGEDSLFLKEQWVSAKGIMAFDTAVSSGIPFIPMDELPPSLSWVGATDSYLVKDRRIVTLFPQTGVMSAHKVNAYVGAGGGSPDTLDWADVDGDSITNEADGLADDPFQFAETGGATK